jgi:uncharacterized protein (TIGR00255 family)
MGQVASMTGFARAAGADSEASWIWELRSVNGRGLELRMKLPAGFDALEPRLRTTTGRRLARGTIQASLALRQDDSAGVTIDQALVLRLVAEAQAISALLPDAPPLRVDALLALPGVVRRDNTDDKSPTEARMAAAEADFGQALDALVEARAAEGARLAGVVGGLLDRLETLRTEAAGEAAQQPEAQRARLREQLHRLLGDENAVPPERLAQEVALLATRADVTEEIERLASHVVAARKLLADGSAIGRQLDFLVQEFMREANTLCSKAGTAALTVIGLQLKGVIEQLREQVQNIE